jgi:AcrR family transcriptional regulator
MALASDPQLSVTASRSGRTFVIENDRLQDPDRGRQIVEAAYDLLDEHGLEGLTIRAVLGKTGLARRAFYERFASKDDLVLAVFEHTLRLAAAHYDNQVKALSDPLEQLKFIVASIVLGRSALDGEEAERGDRRGAAMSREHLRLAESRPADLQRALSPLLTLIARLLAEGMAAGLVRNAAPQRLAALVYNLVSTTMHTELLAEEAAPTEPARRAQLAADIWDFCRRAIVPQRDS